MNIDQKALEAAMNAVAPDGLKFKDAIRDGAAGKRDIENFITAYEANKPQLDQDEIEALRYDNAQLIASVPDKEALEIAIFCMEYVTPVSFSGYTNNQVEEAISKLRGE